MKYERCDDGEILALVDQGHLGSCGGERIPPIAQVIDAGAAVNCDALWEIRLDGVERVEKGAFALLQSGTGGGRLQRRRDSAGAFDRYDNPPGSGYRRQPFPQLADGGLPPGSRPAARTATGPTRFWTAAA